MRAYNVRYADAMRARADRLASTPEAVRERFAMTVWAQGAYAAMSARFPVLTPENFPAADDYRRAWERDATLHISAAAVRQGGGR